MGPGLLDLNPLIYLVFLDSLAEIRVVQGLEQLADAVRGVVTDLSPAHAELAVREW